jgi:hypothetical protein
MLADSHASENGFLEHLTFSSIDEMVGIEKLGEAMNLVGWLEEVEGGLNFINYTEHNGSTAKKRYEDAERQRKCRANKKAKEKEVVTGVTETCDQRREEKNREEKNREEVDGGTTSPSLQQAIIFANEKFPLKTKLRPILGQTEELTEKWHSDREAEGWLTKFGNPIKSWRADLENYADRWVRWEQKNQPGQTKENYLQKLN